MHRSYKLRRSMDGIVEFTNPPSPSLEKVGVTLRVWLW